MYYTITQILTALQHPDGLCRRLNGMRLLYDSDGRAQFSAGNNAIVCRIELHGRIRRLRCYTRPPKIDLAAIYGDKLLRQELYLHSGPNRGEWVDVVLDDWIPGDPLDIVIDRALATHDSPTLLRLSRRFDALAARLVADDWAHGDLKPENIVQTPDDELQLIDLDAMFLPSMEGRRTPELGTSTYQHPTRTTNDFNRWLDHYPAALLSTQLRAFAFDPTLHTRHAQPGIYLFMPDQILSGESPAYDEVLDLFARKCDAVHYRLARALRQPCYRLNGIEELFAHTAPQTPPVTTPEFYMKDGLCGFRTLDRTIVPPVYDEALDFREGAAAVHLGPYWHYIDTSGKPIFHLPADCTAAKSLRNGYARYLQNGTWREWKIR